ncbi:hypothetical protein EJ02DRAFT_114723 [Clathrospora elynae]|uniref:Uncharacterized protein n=1 Tax=Clathrospora elynae TaxID=706981 RepID=A0A6A5SW90_9PLEO|nr:hypothetical protein EJ02DRAFT_114723 [Clathrospora elynae]
MPWQCEGSVDGELRKPCCRYKKTLQQRPVSACLSISVTLHFIIKDKLTRPTNQPTKFSASLQDTLHRSSPCPGKVINCFEVESSPQSNLYLVKVSHLPTREERNTLKRRFVLCANHPDDPSNTPCLPHQPLRKCPQVHMPHVVPERSDMNTVHQSAVQGQRLP